jgi:hypothetical protein
MIRTPCSKVHLRLVKNFPGQPPSGAIVPWSAPGALPKFIKHPAAPTWLSLQRPPSSIGGGGGGGGGGGAAAVSGWGWLPVHPGSAANRTRTIAALIAAPQPFRHGFCELVIPLSKAEITYQKVPQRRRREPTAYSVPYFMVGMTNSAPCLMPDGQRAVTVLVLV